jgi:hypothetical protein
MDNNFFQPGLLKLVHHQEHLAKIERRDVVGPIHVSVWPTNKCQLNCNYCCFGKTMRNDTELDINDFYKTMDVLVKYGLKACEFSGGGEPLLWTHFNEAVEYASNKGLDLSLVSNGLALKIIPQDTLKKFKWIRISVQSTNYAKKINLMNYIPPNVRKSMSYIVYNQKSLSEIEKLYQFAKKDNIIIRVAPNRPCELSWAQIVGDEVSKYGYPLLFFEKESGSPSGCYFAWIRAAITWNGEFLPCPSIELSPESAGKIPDDFAVCNVGDLENWLNEHPVFDLGYRCSHCNCGKSTNNFIHNLLEPMEDVNFV